MAKKKQNTDEPICGSQLNVSRVVIFAACDRGWQTVGQQAEREDAATMKSISTATAGNRWRRHLRNQADNYMWLLCLDTPVIHLLMDK